MLLCGLQHRAHAIAQVKLQLSWCVAWGSSDCTHRAFSRNYLVMIILLNYLAVIISIGELMQNSHCAARVIPPALCSVSVSADRSESLCSHKEHFRANLISAQFLAFRVSVAQRRPWHKVWGVRGMSLTALWEGMGAGLAVLQEI